MHTENTLNHAHLFCKTLDAVSREDLVNGVHQALMQINAVEKGVESLDNRPIQAILSGLLKKAGHIGFEAQMTTKQFLEEIVELAKQLPLEIKGGGAVVSKSSETLTQYWKLDEIDEFPWVEVSKAADGTVTATISGEDSLKASTPLEACDLLAEDCRARLRDAGYTARDVCRAMPRFVRAR